jgi:diguanylate cyclase (GGDEF)-like protein
MSSTRNPVETKDTPLILIVDDLTTNIQLLVHILGGEYRVKFASSGSTALELANGDEKPDLILLDVMMPDMDGYEVCRRLHESPETCDIPVIFVTAKHEACEQVQGFASGGVDFITKPFDLTIVRARVQAHLMLKQQIKRMEEIASLDGLTRIPNRRQLDKTLESEWRRATRSQTSLSLLMIDVDHFKKFNDHYGHSAGDKCLQAVALALQSTVCRPGDFVARYGGEEFTVILQETEEAGALYIAEQLRSAVAALNITHAGSDTCHHVTISIGSATTLPTADRECFTLIEAADQALYQAKRAGRNRAVSKKALLDTDSVDLSFLFHI